MFRAACFSGPVQGGVGVVEAVPLGLLLAEGLDDADALGVFPDHAGHVVGAELLVVVEGNAPAGDEPHGDGDEGHDGDEHQGQHRLHHEGHDHAADQQAGGPDAQTLEHAHHLVDVVGVRGQAGLQGRDREGVQLAGGEVGDLSEQVVADLLRGVPGDPGGDAVGGDVAENGQHGADEHQKARQKDHPPAARGDDVVDDGGQKQGEKQVHDRSAELDDESQDHLRQKRPDVGYDVLQNRKSFPEPDGSGRHIFFIIPWNFRNGKRNGAKERKNRPARAMNEFHPKPLENDFGWSQYQLCRRVRPA